jgi:probable F420-dependent oxidoreductase
VAAQTGVKVRIAVTPPTSAFADDQFTEYLQCCEQLGFDTIWLSDIPLGPLGDPLLSLTYAAACTTKLKLGMNVVPLGRNPLWLAKQLAQLDRLSKGRLLVSLVPGLGSVEERAALGYLTGDAALDHRGNAIDDTIGLMRSWWAGESVTASFGAYRYDGVSLSPRPQQNPLEVWLGGIGPQALDRVARLSDGWLTANATPTEAAAGRQTIEERAVVAGRVIDADHFGISIPYARIEPDSATMAVLKKRRADGDLSEIVPVGASGLVNLLRAHIDGGLTKFVVRSMSGPTTDWRDDLEWLADTVLSLQT